MTSSTAWGVYFVILAAFFAGFVCFALSWRDRANYYREESRRLSARLAKYEDVYVSRWEDMRNEVH